MEYLFDKWKTVEELVLKSERVLLFLDYDGTITPISDRPELAPLPEDTRRLLTALSRTPKYALAIISGRSLEDVKRLVGIEGVYYAGNHGLEAEGPEWRYVHPGALRTKPVIDDLSGRLADVLGSVSGVLVEHKNITLAVHYRRVSCDEVPEVAEMFSKTVKPYLKKGIRTAENKKTLEVLPDVRWGKGEMVAKILSLMGYDMKTLPETGSSQAHGMAPQPVAAKKDILPIYAGDDRTDEDAFKALGGRGVSILVSEKPAESNAAYYVRDVGEVKRFLKMLSGGYGQK